MNINEYIVANRKFSGGLPTVKRVECTDGFNISVQASRYTYCSPREDGGPWTQVECGFPSATPEFIMEYCEDPDRPTETVYGYVPVELVDQLIAHHGGIKA